MWVQDNTQFVAPPWHSLATTSAPNIVSVILSSCMTAWNISDMAGRIVWHRIRTVTCTKPFLHVDRFCYA